MGEQVIGRGGGLCTKRGDKVLGAVNEASGNTVCTKTKEHEVMSNKLIMQRFIYKEKGRHRRSGNLHVYTMRGGMTSQTEGKKKVLTLMKSMMLD